LSPLRDHDSELLTFDFPLLSCYPLKVTCISNCRRNQIFTLQSVGTMFRKIISLILTMLLFIIFTASNTLRADNRVSSADIDRIKQDPTFKKRVSGFTLPLTPAQMNYVLDNLPHASVLLNAYKVHTLQIVASGEKSFHAEDKTGLEGSFELSKSEYHHREYAGNGCIKSKVISQISADVVASIAFEECDVGGITNDLEFWVQVDNLLLDILCRIFQPLLLQILTKKFEHFISVVQQFTRRIQEDPEAAAMILLKSGIREQDVEEFRKVFNSNCLYTISDRERSVIINDLAPISYLLFTVICEKWGLAAGNRWEKQDRVVVLQPSLKLLGVLAKSLAVEYKHNVWVGKADAVLCCNTIGYVVKNASIRQTEHLRTSTCSLS
jgi:hypothetical protein